MLQAAAGQPHSSSWALMSGLLSTMHCWSIDIWRSTVVCQSIDWGQQDWLIDWAWGIQNKTTVIDCGHDRLWLGVVDQNQAWLAPYKPNLNPSVVNYDRVWLLVTD